MTTAATEQPAGKAGPADMIEIFYAPKAVFERRRDGEFGLPLVVLVVLVAVITFATASLMQPLWDAMTAKGLAARAATMTPEQIAAAKSIGAKITMFAQPVTFLILPFVVGLVIWLVAKLASVRLSYGVATMIAVFSLFPRVIGMIVGAAEAAFLPDTALTSPTVLTISPARLLDVSHSPILAAVLARLDLFLLWSIALIAIGVGVTAKATRQQAWTTAIGVWVVGLLPAIWGALRMA